MVPRDIASRAAKERCDHGYGVGETGMSVYLDFSRAIKEQGRDAIEAKYGNLFHMYKKITDENPYEVPMKIYPAVHYTMGGLWVDYNLQSTIPGLFVLGEANFSDHGANRLGASALMQGLADGYFVAPYTVGHHLADKKPETIDTTHAAFDDVEGQVRQKLSTLLDIKGSRSVDSFHRELGAVMWDYCGMARTEGGLKEAIDKIKDIRSNFWQDVRVTGQGEQLNMELEKAGRVADFLEFGELLARDALAREESCGGHFREEHQTEENESKRNDEQFQHVAAWEYHGEDTVPTRHTEELIFDNVEVTTRSYK